MISPDGNENAAVTVRAREKGAFFDEKSNIEKIEKKGDKMINISMNKDI